MSLKAEDLGGQYEVLDKLGSGGMGSLHIVRHRSLGELRVAKELHRQLAGEADHAARFTAEALAASRLRRHPNIVQIFDFIGPDPATGRSGLIIMELIRGADLKRLVTERRLPSLPLSLEIARQSLLALAHLHEVGFVHRDVSPDNLMLTQDHEGQPLVKMIDLGLAKHLDGTENITSEEHFVGKVCYAPPERFDGTGELDARSDIYSFGIVFYELLTGVYPIVGKKTLEIIAGHRYTPPRPFSDTDPEGKVPEELRQLVLRAIAKKPADRPASASELAAAIESLQQHYPMTPRELKEVRRLAPDTTTPPLDLNPSSGIDTAGKVALDEYSPSVTLQMVASSPFVVGQPIGRDEDLFGRDDEKDRLRDTVERGQMAQILGERLMGKTSLLRWVERNAPRWQDRPVVRIDAEGLPGYSSEHMVLAIAKACGEEDRARSDLHRLGGGSRAAAQVLSDFTPLVLLVDDAGTLAQHGHDFDSDFLGVLRALGEDGALLWISASRQNLQRLFREAARTSRFLNNSRQIGVGQLDVEAAEALVGQLKDPVAVQRALERAGGFAYGLQFLADQMWRKPDDLEAAGDTYAAEVESTFQSWWGCCSARKRALLKRCAGEHVRRSDLTRKERLLALPLKELGLLSETDGELALTGVDWQDFVSNAKDSG